MFTSPNASHLEDLIAQVQTELDAADPTQDSYTTAVKNLRELYEARKNAHVDWSKYAPAAASVLGVVLVLGFERTNVVTTKALGLVKKA